ncbi:predicted protein [Micromonas commoda]|uniref:EGF-like domain-containing protein n=1 Tax=Micromonas commoda (strain RCC299 / NOUM17 / CCMP2709) TaxID=296587 RepID=C1DY91_MICCC|nr:predicted protein [Micromonas commoda]ACO61386.1 predicted protein [Micromonas commoda]|eukprot:XP_002500128.1 predicted protein [Micromonas commoda]
MRREVYRAALAALLVASLTGTDAEPRGPDAESGPVSSPSSTRLCPPGHAGVNCSHRLYPLEPNAPNPFVHLDAPLAVGDVALFRLAVNCVAQDATLALEKHGNATDPTVDHLGVGSEVELAVQYGVPPTIEDGGYIDGVVSFSDEPDASVRIGNVLPGVYYAAVHVSAGQPLARFTLRLALEGSRVPNPWNRCEHADEQLLMDVTVEGADRGADPGAEGAGTYAYTRLGPVTGADGYPTALGVADIYEPAYGHCGTLDEETPTEGRAFTLVRTSEEEALGAEGAEGADDARIGRSCYLGDSHSSGRVLDLPQARGQGAVAGTAVLGRSHPDRNDEDYYYLRGDVRKYPGRFLSVNASAAADAPSSESSKSGDVVLFQGVADNPGNFDLEACGDLINPEEVRGKICVVVRGSCFFSSKTLACQRAGAVAAIIVNDRMDEGAADNWVTSHDPAGILIPTVSYGAVHGNQLLREMASASSVTIRLHSYACEPAGHCVACAPGFGFPEDNCTSAACPGMDDARTSACNGRGTCDFDGTNASTFACMCDAGFSGDACEIEQSKDDDAEAEANFTNFTSAAGDDVTSSGVNAAAEGKEVEDIDGGFIDDDAGALQEGAGRYSGFEIFGITLGAVALAVVLAAFAGALASSIRAKRRTRRIDLPALPSTSPQTPA